MAGPRSRTTSERLEHGHPELNDSGFFQTETLSGLIPTNFNQPIYVIFDRTNFRDPRIIYESIRLALQLATCFLTAALPIFHAILCGQVVRLEGIDENGERYYMFPDPLEKLTDEQIAATWALLNRIAEQITFRLDDETDVNAYCFSSPSTAGCMSPNLPGVRSVIHISMRLYNRVAASQGDPSDIVNQQYWAFYLASVLIHELTHAAVHAAVEPRRLHANFYIGESGRTTEVGFETESYLFGNAVPKPFGGRTCYFDQDRNAHSRLQLMICATEYPSAAITQSYNDGAGIAGNTIAVRREHPTIVDVMWHVPFLHLYRMFQDDFWQLDLPRLGRKALWFPKDTGFRFWHDSQSRTLKPLKPHNFDSDGIPEGYWADRHGLLRKRVDKSAKMVQSQTREVHLAMAIRKATEYVWVPDRHASTLRDKASGLFGKLSSRMGNDIHSVWRTAVKSNKG